MTKKWEKRGRGPPRRLPQLGKPAGITSVRSIGYIITRLFLQFVVAKLFSALPAEVTVAPEDHVIGTAVGTSFTIRFCTMFMNIKQWQLRGYGIAEQNYDQNRKLDTAGRDPVGGVSSPAEDQSEQTGDGYPPPPTPRINAIVNSRRRFSLWLSPCRWRPNVA